MKQLPRRRQAPTAAQRDGGAWRGPRTIPVVSASGGAGASTLCALLAGAIVESTGTAERRVLIVDGAAGGTSPWPDWLSPGLDPELGEEGYEGLEPYVPSSTGFPRSMVRRCSFAARGLDGALILTSPQDRAVGPDLDAVMPSHPVVILDLPSRPDPDVAERVRNLPAGLILAISGNADGIGAGLRSVRRWAALGVAPSRIRPVVIATGAGALPPRARARIALLDSNTQPIILIPFDPAIARRGLAEALACGAVGAPTRLAVRRLATALSTSTGRAEPASSLDALSLFAPAPDVVPAQRETPIPAYEGTSR